MSVIPPSYPDVYTPAYSQPTINYDDSLSLCGAYEIAISTLKSFYQSPYVKGSLMVGGLLTAGGCFYGVYRFMTDPYLQGAKIAPMCALAVAGTFSTGASLGIVVNSCRVSKIETEPLL